MTRLYHYTADEDTHWGKILRDGRIVPLALTGRAGDAPQTHPQDGLLDGVVHLTDDPGARPENLGLVMAESLRKTEIRIEVDVPAITWARWLKEVRFDARYAAALAKTSGWQAHHWRVATFPIPKDRWIEAVDTRTGEVVWP